MRSMCGQPVNADAPLWSQALHRLQRRPGTSPTDGPAPCPLRVSQDGANPAADWHAQQASAGSLTVTTGDTNLNYQEAEIILARIPQQSSGEAWVWSSRTNSQLRGAHLGHGTDSQKPQRHVHSGLGLGLGCSACWGARCPFHPECPLEQNTPSPWPFPWLLKGEDCVPHTCLSQVLFDRLAQLSL